MPFLPLLVRAPVSLGAAERDHHVGSNADGRLTFDGIPQ